MTTIKNQTEFEKEVLESKWLVLVDFWAEWCWPCRMMEPILEQLENNFVNKLKIVKVNVEENPDIATKYNIQAIPTLILFKDWQKVEEQVGALPYSQLYDIIQQYLD